MSEIVNFTDYILFNKNSKIIMSENPITLVLGASENPGRYSHMAVNKLRAYGHNVIALGKKEGIIGDTPIIKLLPENTEIDTLTLYVRDDFQDNVEEMVKNHKIKRVIFNPGTENPSLAQKLQLMGIKTENACTLVLLSLGEY